MGFLYEPLSEREGEIELKGYSGKIEYLKIPKEIDGMRVCSIGSRAFEGREDIVELWLPDSIRRLSAFAFYNCHRLERLHLKDSVTDYRDGVIRLCEQLSFIELSLSENGSFRLLKEMLGDHDGSLCFHLNLEKGEELELFFPDFSDDFLEDTYARALHERIEGSGYEYRQTVKRTELDIRHYDRLFARGRREPLRYASEIAISRLRYPYRLMQDAEEQYREYLLERNEELIRYLIDGSAFDKLEFLLEHELVTESGLDISLPLLSEKSSTELTALFMNYRRMHFKSPGATVFSLDEL